MANYRIEIPERGHYQQDVQGVGNGDDTEKRVALIVEMYLKQGVGDISVTRTDIVPSALIEKIARAFHDAYEEIAPQAGWETQERSRKPWEDVPEANRRVMLLTVEALLKRGVIR